MAGIVRGFDFKSHFDDGKFDAIEKWLRTLASFQLFHNDFVTLMSVIKSTTNHNHIFRSIINRYDMAFNDEFEKIVYFDMIM